MSFIQATLFQSYQGQVLENVLQFQGGGGQDTLELNLLIDDLIANWINQVRSQQVTDLRYVQIKAEFFPVGVAPVVRAINIPGVNGGNNNDKTTYAHVLRKKTGFAGKRGRGRCFIGGIANNADQLSFLDSQRIANWQTVCANLMARYGVTGTSDFIIGIWTRTDPAGTFKPLVQLEIAPQYSNVQSRKVGRGI